MSGTASLVLGRRRGSLRTLALAATALCLVGGVVSPVAGPAVAEVAGQADVNAGGPGAAPAGPYVEPPLGPEVVSLRNEHSKTFAVVGEAGRYVSRISQAPVHFKDAQGAWQDIDATLASSADGRLRTRANTVAVDVAAVAGDGPLGRVELDAGHSVGFRLEGATPVPATVAGGKATYAEVLPGVAVELTPYWAGLKEDLVLTSKAAPDTYLFPLVLRGVTPRLEAETGDIVYRNEAGDVVARTPHGSMDDSAPPKPAGEPTPSLPGIPGHSDGVAYELVPYGDGGTALRVKLDRAWLDDPARVYPVRVDPTTTFNANTDDTYVKTNDTTRNDVEGQLYSGTYNAGAEKFRSFIHFDTAWLRGRAKGISYARVAMWLQTGYNCTARPTSMYRVTQGWWGGNMASYPGASVGEEIHRMDINPCPSGWIQWGNLQGVVHNWAVSQAWADHGIMVKAYDEGDNSIWRHWYSANSPGYSPHLVVDWWGLPNTPDSLSPGDGTYTAVPALGARYTHSDEGTGGNLYFNLYNSGGSYLFQSPGHGVCHGCSASYTPSSLSDGRYQWDVVASDANGRGSPYTGRMWFTLDRKPNTPDNVSPPAGTDSAGPPTLSARYNHVDPGNSSGQIVFRVYDAADTFLSETYSASVCKGCTATFTPSGLADGQYKWEAVAYDGGGTGNGNAFSSATTRRTFRIDTTAPAAPEVASSSHPDPATWYQARAVSASWTAPADATGISGYAVAVDQAADTAPTATVTQTGTSYSTTVASDGQWYLHVRARDGVGNWGATTHFGIKADAATPGTPLVTSSTHPDPSVWYSSPDPTLAWSGGDTASGLGGWSFQLDQVEGTTPDETSEGTFASRSYTALPDGPYWFHVRRMSSAGVWGPPGHFGMKIDGSPPPAPTVSSSSHPDQNTWYANRDLSATWSAGDMSGVAGYSWVLDNSATTLPDSTSEGTATTLSRTGLADGEWYLHVRAQNGAGTWGPATHLRIRIDAGFAPPTVTSPTHPDQNAWYTNNDPSFSFATTEESGITGYSYTFNGVDPDTVSEGTASTRAYVDMPDGPYVFKVRAQNGMGQWSGVTSFTVRIDATAPSITSTSSSTHPVESTWYANDDPVLSWTASDTAPVDGYSWILDQFATTTPDTTSEGTATTKSYSNLADGTWWFHLRARNATGTWGPTVHRAVRIDAVFSAPAITSSTHPDQNAWYAGNDPSFSFATTQESGIVGYSYTFDGVDPDTVSEGTASTRAYVDKPDGTHVFKVRAQNGAGQWSAAASYTVRIDATATSVASVSSSTHPVEATWYAHNDPAVSWTASDTAPVDGYSWILDRFATTTPDTTSEGTAAGASWTDVADGTHWFHVRARNATGTWGPTVHRAVRVETTAPGAPVVTSSTHPVEGTWYTSNSPTLDFPTTDDSGVDNYSYVLDQVAATVPDTTTEGSAAGKSYTGLADGTWWFHVRARNTLGMWGTTAHFSIRVDGTTGAPSVASTTHPSPSTWYGNDSPALSWSGSYPSGVSGWSYVLDQVAATVPDTTSEGTATTKAYSALADGTWWFHVRAQNGATGWSDTAHFAIRVDDTAPSAAVVSSSTHPTQADWYPNGNPSLSFPVTDTAPVDGYSYVLDAAATTDPDLVSEGTASSRSYTGLADGTHWFHVKARNSSGLWGTTAHFRVNVDTSAPAAPAVSSSTHPAQSAWYTANAPAFAFPASDTSGVIGYSYVLDQVATTTPDTTSEGTATTRSYTGLADGTHWFHVRARNGAGQWGATTHFAVQIDGSAPPPAAVSSTTHPDQAAWYAAADATVAFAVTDTAPVDGYSYVLDASATTDPDLVSEGTASTRTFTGLTDGTHWFHVKARNSSGLWGATAHFRVNVDTTAPGAPVLSSSTHPVPSTWYPGNAPTFEFPASDTSGIGGYSYVLDQTATTTPDTTSEGSAASRSYTGLADGTWWFHVRARNGSGQWGTTSHLQVRIDASAPVMSALSSSTHPDEAAWSSSSTATVSFGASDTSGVNGYSWTFDAAPATTPDTVSEGTTTTASEVAGDGIRYFHVRARNGSGTWGPARHYTLRTDAVTAAPTSLTSSSHPDQARWYPSRDATLAWTASEESPITGYATSATPDAPGNPGTEVTTTASSLTTALPEDRVWYVNVRARNGAGVWSPTSSYRFQADASPPPVGAFSNTHPESTRWYTNNSPSFSLSSFDVSGITGYSYVLDQVADSTPDEVSEGPATTVDFTGVADAEWWFHVRAQNGAGSWGTPRHVRVRVDTTAPLIEGHFVEPQPAPVDSEITFFVNWGESSSAVTAIICRTEAFADGFCVDGEWTRGTPERGRLSTARRVVGTNQLGHQSYTAYLCDEAGLCSPGSGGTFDVTTVESQGQNVNGYRYSDYWSPTFTDRYEYMPYKWDTSRPRYWQFSSRVPRTAVRDRIRDGLRQWMNHANTVNVGPRFHELSGEVEGESSFWWDCGTVDHRNNAMVNVVTWENTSVGAPAYQSPCFREWPGEDHMLAGGVIVIDPRNRWYVGTGDAPSNTLDLWSTMSHEWGHTMGFQNSPGTGPDDEGHFPESSAYCPENGDRHTMCPGDYPGLQRQRTLEFWDKGMFSRAYFQGYWLVASNGSVYARGWANHYGDAANIRGKAPIVGMGADPQNLGYWLAAADGGVFTFGRVRFHGSMGGKPLNAPIVGMAATPTGNGYWLVASDGGIFSFGDARFYGSLGGIRLNQPIVGMAPTPYGNGYWMVAADGGVFSFGDAQFKGSFGSTKLPEPIVGIASYKNNKGYWLLRKDGAVGRFGEAANLYWGDAFGEAPPGSVTYVGIVRPRSGRGYNLISWDPEAKIGRIRRFGDAPFFGNPPENLGSRIVGGASIGSLVDEF